MLEKIKQWFFERAFRKEVTVLQRKRKAMSLSKAKSIGVVYDASDEKRHGKVEKLVKQLQEKGKIVRVLGWVDSKLIPHYCIPKLSYDYISVSQQNWFGKPAGPKVQDFVGEEFDLLISLDMEHSKASRYVIGASRALMKAGPSFDEKDSLFDLIIQCDDKTSMDTYWEELIKYLEMINNG